MTTTLTTKKTTTTAPRGNKSIQSAIIKDINWTYRSIDGLHIEMDIDTLAAVLAKELGIQRKVKDTETDNGDGFTNSLILMNNWADRYYTSNKITYTLTKNRYITIYIYDNNEQDPVYHIELFQDKNKKPYSIEVITIEYKPTMGGWGHCRNTLRRYMGHCPEESEGYIDADDTQQYGYTETHVEQHAERMEEIHAGDMAENIIALTQKLRNDAEWTNFIK